MSARITLFSPQMARIAQQMAAAHEVDLSQKDAVLLVKLPRRPDCWRIANLDGCRVSGTHGFVERDGGFTFDLDMVFVIHPTLAAYADEWAEVLRGQGWIGSAVKTVTNPLEQPEEDYVLLVPPDYDELWQQVEEYGMCQAADGCWRPPDGACEHGHKSLLLEWR